MNQISNMEVKKTNRNRVYRLLYNHGQKGYSKKEIATILNMSMPTLTQNLKELEEQNLIEESGIFASTGGRKAKAISCNYKSKISMGIDITRNHIVFVAIDLGAEVTAHIRLHFPFENTPRYFQELKIQFDKFIDENHLDRNNILGVGISLPGILSEDHQYLRYGDVIDYNGESLDVFRKLLPFPCKFSNDASAGGFAEFWNEGVEENAVYLYLSNSVGGSIVIGKKMYLGNHHKSAEFGHLTLVDNGKVCYCGRKGCVNAYCSAAILSDTADGSLEKFFQLVQEKKEPQMSVWKEYEYYLCRTINNLRIMFDCDVILGGYVGGYLNPYIDEIRNEVKKVQLFESDDTAEYVKVCNYKFEAAAVGAALLHVEEYIEHI